MKLLKFIKNIIDFFFKTNVDFTSSFNLIANHIFLYYSFIVCSMAYQASWVIQCQNPSFKRTVKVLFNQLQGGKGRVHIFPKGICPKENVIVRLEFELAYYDSALQCFSHYITSTPPLPAFITCTNPASRTEYFIIRI